MICVTWTRDDENPLLDVTAGDWDSDMQCYPHVFECDGRVFLLYNGNEFGRHGFGAAVLEAMSAPVEFRVNQAGVAEIAEHLTRCDGDFVPPLSDRVELGSYAHKIGHKAMRFEAWADGTLVGLVAAYCNDAERRTAYITSVSVEHRYRRMGVASELMERCIAHTTQHGFECIELEADTEHAAAVDLYAEMGFAVEQRAWPGGRHAPGC